MTRWNNSLKNNRFSDGDLDSLIGTLIECKRLNNLWLPGNGIGVRGCTAVAKLLRNSNSEITYLHLDDNSIDDESLAILLESLAGNNALKTLHLNGNDGISREGWKSVLKFVCNASSIDGVAQSNHVLYDVGA